IRLPVRRISSAVLSTTQPPLRGREGARSTLTVARYVSNGMSRDKGWRPPGRALDRRCGRSRPPEPDVVADGNFGDAGTGASAPAAHFLCRNAAFPAARHFSVSLI